MDKFLLQLITVLSLLAGNALFGTLPLLITKLVSGVSGAEQEQVHRLRSAAFLLFFGGGVFISDCFLVLLPQANENFEEAHEGVDDEPAGNHHHHSFPIPELVVVGSFFAAYVLQELIYFILYKFSSVPRKSSDVRVQFCSCAKRHTECSRTYKAARPDPELFSLDKKLMESGIHAAYSTSENYSTFATVDPTASRSQQVPSAQSDLLRSSIIAQTIPNYGTLTNVTEPPTDSQLPVLSPPVLLAEERNQAHQAALLHSQNVLIVGNMLALLALMLQFLFLSFSLAELTASHASWCSLVVACSQSWVLTFSACSGFASSAVDLLYVAMNVALLSVIAPIGLVAAMINSEFVDEIPPLSKGLVAAIACGILMYTTFYEVLKKKGEVSLTGLLKFAAILLGSSTMAVLQYAALNL